MVTVTWRPVARCTGFLRAEDFRTAHPLASRTRSRAGGTARKRTTNYVGASVRIMDETILSPPHDSWGAFKGSKFPEPAAQTPHEGPIALRDLVRDVPRFGAAA
jgi:hypothetical protein